MKTTLLPIGQSLLPTAAPGALDVPLIPGLPDNPTLPAGFAQSQALSPDGKTLLVLTTGYNDVVDATRNKIPADSTQFIFVFDTSTTTPTQKQVLQVSNSYVGIVFSPDGKKFSVPGAGEDKLHIVGLTGSTWAETGSPIKLGHATGNGLAQGPTATGVAVTADGTRAVVANRYNDSVTIVDLVNHRVMAEQAWLPCARTSST